MEVLNSSIYQKKQLKNVNTVHNKAVRALVCARKPDPLSKIFRELRLLKLIDIYYYNLGIFAYQKFYQRVTTFFDNYALSHNKPARYITRLTKNTVFDFTSDPIFYNQPHLQKTLLSIKFSAAALWNKLPLTLKQHAQLKILCLILHLILYFIISLIYKKLFNLSNSQLQLCGINCR